MSKRDCGTFRAWSAHFVGKLETRTVNEEDWANAWKEYFHVTHIGKRLVIRPSWREYTPKPHEVVLTLRSRYGIRYRAASYHAHVPRTTGGVCSARNACTGCRNRFGDTLYRAALFGAESVYAIDNSSVAAESATANVALNGLSERVKVVLGLLDDAEATRMAGQYDLVVANIIAHIIGSIAPQLARVMVPGGLLIASGIIEARRQDAEGSVAGGRIGAGWAGDD